MKNKAMKTTHCVAVGWASERQNKLARFQVDGARIQVLPLSRFLMLDLSDLKMRSLAMLIYFIDMFCGLGIFHVSWDS